MKEIHFQSYVFEPILVLKKLKRERHGYKNEKTILNLTNKYLPFTVTGGTDFSKTYKATADELKMVQAFLTSNNVDINKPKEITQFIHEVIFNTVDKFKYQFPVRTNGKGVKRKKPEKSKKSL